MKKTYYIPAKLDIHALVKANPPSIERFKIEKLAYLIDLIATNNELEKKKYKRKGYAYLKSAYLKENGLNDYKKYLNYLLDLRIIQCDHFFITDFKSKGYRIHPDYFSKVRAVLLDSRKFTSKTKKVEDYKAQKQYDYLYKWFDNGQPTMDYNKFMAEYEENKVCTENKSREEATRMYNSRISIAGSIHYNETHFSVDTSVRRLSTSITRCPKDIRHYLSYNNEYKFVEVDIKNSVPFFSLVLFSPSFYSTRKSKLNVFDLFPDKHILSITKLHQFEPTLSKISPIIIMWEKSLKPSERQELNKYEQSVCNGSLYAEFQQRLQSELKRPVSMEEAKDTLLKSLNSSNKSRNKKKLVFRKMYPTVTSFFLELKKKNHRIFSYLTMRIESFLVLDVACKRLSQLYPDLPIYTLHDCIITIDGHQDKVSKVLSDVIKEYTGYEGRFSIKRWDDDYEKARIEKEIKR